jgi:hypothetical protein
MYRTCTDADRLVEAIRPISRGTDFRYVNNCVGRRSHRGDGRRRRLIHQLNSLGSDCPEDAGRKGAGRKILVVIGTRSGTGKETALRFVKDGFPDHAGRPSGGVLPVDQRPLSKTTGRILTVDRGLHEAFLRVVLHEDRPCFFCRLCVGPDYSGVRTYRRVEQWCNNH